MSVEMSKRPTVVNMLQIGLTVEIPIDHWRAAEAVINAEQHDGWWPVEVKDWPQDAGPKPTAVRSVPLGDVEWRT